WRRFAPPRTKARSCRRRSRKRSTARSARAARWPARSRVIKLRQTALPVRARACPACASWHAALLELTERFPIAARPSQSLPDSLRALPATRAVPVEATHGNHQIEHFALLHRQRRTHRQQITVEHSCDGQRRFWTFSQREADARKRRVRTVSAKCDSRR